MRRTLPLLLAGALLAALAARAPAGKPKTDATSTRAKAKDICKGCIDPYKPAAERGKFFKAAGVDSELDATEFETDKTRDGGFVRKFDTWRGMLAFDKNANKTLDWFEADAYRRDLRTRVLAVYDKDKDRRLKGKERDAANAALAAGKIPAAGGLSGVWGGGAGQGRIVFGGGQGGVVFGGGQMSPAARIRMFDKDRDGKLNGDEKAAADKWQADAEKRRAEYARKAERWRKLNDELRKKHDADGDGRLDADERKAYYEEYRERAKIVQWDTDGDGKLSDDERKEMETRQAEWKRRAEENRRKWMLQRWDKDKDGQISEEETAAMEAQQAEWKERAERYRREQEELRNQHDADGDGKLNDTERKAYYDAMRRKWQLRQWDKDKDGRLDDGERKAMEDQQAKMRKRNEEYRRKWELRRWDKNKDGQIDDAERKAMDEERARWRRPANVIINGGSLSPGGFGGVRVWSSGGVTGRATIIVRPGGPDEDKPEE